MLWNVNALTRKNHGEQVNQILSQQVKNNNIDSNLTLMQLTGSLCRSDGRALRFLKKTEGSREEYSPILD